MCTRIVLITLLSWIILTNYSFAETDLDTLFVTIDGIDYEVELEKSGLAERVQVISEDKILDVNVDIELYRGTAPDIPGSWVAVSYHEGNWSGLASLHNKLYEIDGANFGSQMTDKGDAIRTTSMLTTEFALTGDFDISRMCPVAHIEDTDTNTSLTTLVPNSSTAQLNNVALAVGGITQAANVALALDHFYLASYGNGSVARALQILNNVDVIYRNSLGIALNNIAVQTFSAAAQFPIAQPDITDANILLNEIFNFQANVFGNNDRTLGALLTTRDIEVPGNQGVAGIAPVPATCETQGGLNLAVSVNEDRAGTGVASVILAHEMGHNFGSLHDPIDPNDPNFAICPSGQFIMSPVVVANLTAFSSCSQTQIANHIAGGTCYKQPIDIQISLQNAVPAVATPLTQGNTSSRTYSISNATDMPLTNLNINASIENLTDPNNANAVYTTVTLNGNACAIANGGQSYTCTIPTINGNNLQALPLNELITTTGIGQFKTTVEYQNAAFAQLIDIETQNNFIEVTQNINAPNIPPQAPNNVQATPQGNGDILITWNDNSNNEQAFIIERSEDNGATFNVIQANLAANSTSYTDSNVVGGQTYTYRVSASNAIGAALAPTTPSATSISSSASAASSGGGGGGGAFYLLTVFILLARALIKFR